MVMRNKDNSESFHENSLKSNYYKILEEVNDGTLVDIYERACEIDLNLLELQTLAELSEVYSRLFMEQ